VVAAEALMAYRRGDNGEVAMIGAMLEAQHFQHVRGLAKAYLKPRR